MWEVPSTLGCVITEDDLIRACLHENVHVVFLPFPLPGAYFAETGLIVVDCKRPPSHQLAILAHEYVHATMGHEGCQPEHVERLVARKAAGLLVSPVEFKTAAMLHDDNLVSVAEELNLPLWVVEAYVQHRFGTV